MDKQRMCIEHELRSKSANIIWPLISTPAGLAKWVADDVRREDDKLIFTWGETWRHHEIRVATIAEVVKNSHIKIYWDDDEEGEAFCTLALEKGDITNDYILIITEFALQEDIESLKKLWNKNLARLHRTTGL